MGNVNHHSNRNSGGQFLFYRSQEIKVGYKILEVIFKVFLPGRRKDGNGII